MFITGCFGLWDGYEQLEWLTGGECAAGMHEVVVSENTQEAIKAARNSDRSLWRVSSTVIKSMCIFSACTF